MIKKLIFAVAFVFLFSFFTKSSYAATTQPLLPVLDGAYTQWSPSNFSFHVTNVDEAVCNGNTDYNFETTAGQRDSYTVNLSSIPDGSTITQISITPCASKHQNGGTNTVFDVFYRLNGVNSADMPGYMLSTTTPSVLAATNYSGLSIVKTGSTSLEIGGIYTSGNKGVRLSQISTTITYTAPVAPSVTTSSASAISQTTATLNSVVNPNGFSTNVRYRYGTSNVDCSLLPNATALINVGSGLVNISPNAQNISTLSANTTYYYCAVGTNVGGTTNGAVLSFTTLPNAPTVITSAASSITTNSASVSGYVTPNGSSTNRIFRYGTTNVGCASLPNTTTPVNVGSGTSQIFGTQNISGLNPSTTYYYCVSATNAGGTSNGTVFNFTTQVAAPNAPSNLLVNKGSSTTAVLTWQDNSNNETNFRIERSFDGSTGWTQVGSTSANITTFTNTNLFSQQPYYYRVYATNSTGNSGYSNVYFINTEIPNNPTNFALTATMCGGSPVTMLLTWQDNSFNEESFEIEAFDGATFTPLTTVAANVTSYSFTGTECIYRIRAVNPYGASDWHEIDVIH